MERKYTFEVSFITFDWSDINPTQEEWDDMWDRYEQQRHPWDDFKP